MAMVCFLVTIEHAPSYPPATRLEREPLKRSVRLLVTALPQKSISVETSFVFSSCELEDRFPLARKTRTIHEVTRTNTNQNTS
jgi:hypothetical protein